MCFSPNHVYWKHSETSSDKTNYNNNICTRQRGTLTFLHTGANHLPLWYRYKMLVILYCLPWYFMTFPHSGLFGHTHVCWNVCGDVCKSTWWSYCWHFWSNFCLKLLDECREIWTSQIFFKGAIWKKKAVLNIIKSKTMLQLQYSTFKMANTCHLRVIYVSSAQSRLRLWAERGFQDRCRFGSCSSEQVTIVCYKCYKFAVAQSVRTWHGDGRVAGSSPA